MAAPEVQPAPEPRSLLSRNPVDRFAPARLHDRYQHQLRDTRSANGDDVGESYLAAPLVYHQFAPVVRSGVDQLGPDRSDAVLMVCSFSERAWWSQASRVADA